MVKVPIKISRSIMDLYLSPLFLLIGTTYPLRKTNKESQMLVVDLLTSRNDTLRLSSFNHVKYGGDDDVRRNFSRNLPFSLRKGAILSFILSGKPQAIRRRLGISEILRNKVYVSILERHSKK